MTRHIILTLLLFLSLHINAQNISVADFKYDQSDLTANTQGTIVTDQNGEKCALIKIYTTATGFTYDTGSLGIVKEVQKDGEIWLYVPHGIRKLNLNHKQLGFCQYSIPIAINKSCTYKMVLTTGKVVTTVIEDDGLTYFTLVVSPANAMVMIDDDMKQPNAEGQLSLRLKRGEHKYTVAAAGYETKTSAFTIGAEKKSERISLISKKAHLTLQPTDSNVIIYVNGNTVPGNVRDMELQADNYLIEAKQEGYHTFSTTLTLAEKETKTLTIPALTPITGKIDVNYSPLDSEVWLDDKKLGSSPDVFSNIIIGSHKLYIVAKGYVAKTDTILVKENETVVLSGALKKGGDYGEENYHQWVDLGLPSGLKWATMNVGATKVEDYGTYYAWGEVLPHMKYAYTQGSYKYSANSGTMIKYCTNSIYGVIDNKNVLEPKDDAAALNWGGTWRLPTVEEIKELEQNTTCTWTQSYHGSGIAGNIFKSKTNENSIFLPAAGYSSNYSLDYVGTRGYYWTSSLDLGNNTYANMFGFYLDHLNNLSNNRRFCGQSIRAVCR